MKPLKPIKSVKWSSTGGKYTVEWKADNMLIEYRRAYFGYGDDWTLIYYDGEEKKKKNFYSPDALDDFVIMHYNAFLEQHNIKEKRKWQESQLIHIKHATQDNYLDVQQELMEQGNKIIGVDVICTTPPNPYVYIIKYQKESEC